MLNNSEIINMLGEDNADYFNAIAPPIIQTSNYRFKSIHHIRKAMKREKENLIYSRGNNPTLSILSKKLAALEGAEDALLFASGMAAISTAIVSNIKKGDHIICVSKPYSRTKHLLTIILPRFGVEHTFIDGKDIRNFIKTKQKNTSLIYLESPNSWTFELQDLNAVAKFAKENKITTIIDNSYSSPLNQQPIKHGIDIVVHSATKYIGGHSDTVAGVLCSNKKMIKKIFGNEYLTFGGVISPFNAWLLLRGLRTLPLRMERHAQTASKLLDFLDKHPKVEKVFYPFSEKFPQYKLARKQMKQGGGLLSFTLKTKDIQKIERFCDSLKHFQIAVSWGGYESLVFPVCTFVDDERFSELPVNLVRLYAGLEDAEMLLKDLTQAFKKV
jgi:cystathionine beta-lyase/cystathionine gamma-synthase